MHASVLVSPGHAEPPLLEYVVTVREPLLVPPAHVLLHSPHVYTVITQFTVTHGRGGEGREGT